MKPRWDNIAVLGLIIFALIVLSEYPMHIGFFLRSMEHMGSGSTPDEQLMGLMAFGLVAITILGVIKIVLQNNRNDGGDD